ncbi:16914_t:CDS:2 [Gigaspora margarita]|uniref:16914_t:CDS:1 n=1 Tax=Gigaspora margarita TaxID=4874 RepID=A0ABN7VRI9_GIGMA|nr:16914_t:CDS:2 [Gigaspora margarita]
MDDIPIINNAYDLEDEEAAETVLEKLIKNARNLDKDSRSHKITEFFDKANNMNLNNNEITQSDYASESETEIIEKSSQWEQKLQETEERIQYLIDTNEISKTDKVKYISAIHYIKLLQNNTSKLEASRIATKFQVTPQLVKEYFEKHILPELHIDRAQTIFLATSRHWIIKIRFNYKRYKKGVYFDSHEREDVIVYRREFLQKIEEYDRLMPKWNDINCEIYKEPNLLPAAKKKGLEKELHISEFLTKMIRRLKDEEGEARVIVETDRSQDENWDGKKLLSQVKNAIGIFEQTHSGCIGIWAFDNATSHTVIVPDALVAARMNLYPGELNHIEMYWSAVKKCMRENCDYTWKGLKNKVPIALDSIPVETIRKHARLSYRWMDAYRKGLTGQAANYAVKKYKSHRSIPRAELIENS